MPSREEMNGLYVAALGRGGLDLLAKTLAEEVGSWWLDRRLDTGEDGELSYYTWLEYFDRPMRRSVALVICSQDISVGEELDGVAAWEDFLGNIDFSYEMRDQTTMVLYPEEEELEGLIREAFAFEWYSRLVAPDYAAIYSGVYLYFAQNGESMGKLHWRAFEELLAAVFAEQGYETILGTGRADGGVDIRLTRNSIYGDQVTLVQAKRHKRAIKLEQVAALSGVMQDQQVARGIFVTTSRFLPVAQKFAARQASEIILATSKDVSRWCEAISSKKVPAAILGAALRSSDIAPNRIVCADLGLNDTYYQFAYIVAQSPTAVRLAMLPSRDLPEMRRDGGRQGRTVPDFAGGLEPETPTITARRTNSSFSEDEYFWGDDGHSYRSWTGYPMQYMWYD